MSSIVRQQILERINAIKDPCSMSQAMPIGLSDMGLVTALSLHDAEGQYDVTVTLRVTAPGCMYVPFMDRAVSASLDEMDEVRSVTTQWQTDSEWSPSDIAPTVRAKLAASRARRAANARPGAHVRGQVTVNSAFSQEER